jgi:two-component system sensor histidine kinase HydH
LSARQKDSAVVISIKDQGPGIKGEDLDKIFNPFFTTKEAGTGLGLSVVHQIVTQHGGTVTTETNSDSGMTFSVVIPLHHRKNS